MLVDFQMALADLTASPALCRAVRATPDILRARYDLTDKEWRRLAGIAASKGMEANCMLYRANRLAPVALNLPETCTALGDALNPLISAYWDAEPTTNVHFLIEADRFCRFLRDQPGLSPVALAHLQREHHVIMAKLAVTETMAVPAPNAPTSPHAQE
ncbi:MAG: hypothetical protein AB7O88_05670 [Reyranellaceae bacterium]